MATNRTFTMIKPDAVENGHIGGILNMIAEGGFKIVSLKLTQLTIADAQAFYAVHAARPFFGELVEFMTRGPIVAAILEKENAVEDFRTLIGATNPANAAEGTIRKKHAESVQCNAVHGSDSDENAIIECNYFFSIYNAAIDSLNSMQAIILCMQCTHSICFGKKPEALMLKCLKVYEH